VLDLLYAAQDNQLRADFEGKKVQLIGQLMPDKTSNASGRRFKGGAHVHDLLCRRCASGRDAGGDLTTT
jgi:hypothetical protein